MYEDLNKGMMKIKLSVYLHIFPNSVVWPCSAVGLCLTDDGTGHDSSTWRAEKHRDVAMCATAVLLKAQCVIILALLIFQTCSDH